MSMQPSLEFGSETSGLPDFEDIEISVVVDSTMPSTDALLPSPTNSCHTCVTSGPSSNPLPSSLCPADGRQLEIILTSDGKQCYSCRRFMPLSAFAKYLNAGREYRVRRCNACRAYRQKLSPKGQARAQMLLEAKSKPCADCKGTFPPECMDFDHVEGEKAFLVSSAFAWKRLDQLKAEVKKCELVCSNCHRIRTKQRKQAKGRPTKFLAELPFDPKHVDPVVLQRKNREQTYDRQ